jgi:protein-S-isoprenylcysteine O-methyltransferase Ste14
MDINVFYKLIELLKYPFGIFEIISLLIIVLCFCAVSVSVIIDFIKYDSVSITKREKRSVVATGTMALFFLCFYLFMRLGIGRFQIDNLYFKLPIITIGLALVVIGSVVNIRGRLDLGKNWANHIKIYKNHSLVEKGVYKLVRHPLYASLMWAFYGASFVYLNYYAFLLNTFVFIPFMYYRAKQEEELLEKEFSDYNNYKLKVGMFFPKLFRKYEKI